MPKSSTRSMRVPKLLEKALTSIRIFGQKRGLDTPAETQDVPAVLPEVEDRVPDELTGRGIGDVAAAADLKKLDAFRPKLFRRMAKVGRRLRPPQRHHRRMLYQDERVRNAILDALLEQRELSFQNRAVRRKTEVKNPPRNSGVGCGGRGSVRPRRGRTPGTQHIPPRSRLTKSKPEPPATP